MRGRWWWGRKREVYMHTGERSKPAHGRTHFRHPNSEHRSKSESLGLASSLLLELTPLLLKRQCRFQLHNRIRTHPPFISNAAFLELGLKSGRPPRRHEVSFQAPPYPTRTNKCFASHVASSVCVLPLRASVLVSPFLRSPIGGTADSNYKTWSGVEAAAAALARSLGATAEAAQHERKRASSFRRAREFRREQMNHGEAW